MNTEHPSNADPEKSRATDDLLHRFVDGDLRGSDRAAVAGILASDAAALQRANAYQNQTMLLQSLYPPQLQDTELTKAGERVAGRLRQRRRLRHSFVAGVGCLALVGAGLGGWQAHQSLTQSPPPQVFAVFPPANIPTLSQGGGEAQTVGNEVKAPIIENLAWLADRASGIPIKAPSLDAVGFEYVGGRADLTAYGSVIRFAYRALDEANTGLTVAVAGFSQDRRSLTTSVDPTETSLFWAHGGYFYALSGSVSPTVLSDAAAAITAGSQSAPIVPVPAPPMLTVEPTDDQLLPVLVDTPVNPESL